MKECLVIFNNPVDFARTMAKMPERRGLFDTGEPFVYAGPECVIDSAFSREPGKATVLDDPALIRAYKEMRNRREDSLISEDPE